MSDSMDARRGRRLVAALVFAAAAHPAAAAEWKVPFEGSRSRPALADGVLYVGSEDGVVHALDARSGAVQWRFQAAADVPSGSDVVTVRPGAGFQEMMAAGSKLKRGRRREIQASPVVADGTVFVGSGDGVFHALDAAAGRERWSFQAGGPITHRAALRGGLVIFVADDGLLYGLAAETGRKAWAFDTLAEVPEIKRRPPSAPMLADGVAYHLTWPIPDVTTDGHVSGEVIVRAIDAVSGREKWSVRVDGSSPSPLRLVQGLVFLCTESSGRSGPVVMRALDALSGVEKWQYRAQGGFGSATAVVALGDTAFFGTEHGIHALDVRTGAVRWTRAGERLPSSGPDDGTNPNLDVDADTLYVAVRDGTLSGGKRGGLWALDPATGRERWRSSSDGQIAGIDGAAVYLHGDGRLQAISRTTGKTIRSAGAGNSNALPLVVEGVAFVPEFTTTYFGTTRRDQGHLRALDLNIERK